MPLTPEDFGTSFKSFMDQMSAQAGGSPFVERLSAHLGGDAKTLPVVTETFLSHDHPNVQVALDEQLAQPGRSHELIGIKGGQMSFFQGPHLADLVGAKGAEGPTEGPVEFNNVELGDRVLTCVKSGLYLISGVGPSLVVMLSQGMNIMRQAAGVDFEVMAADRDVAEKFLHEIRQGVKRCNVYRGRVLTVTEEGIKLQSLPKIDRDRIILPHGMLERIERHAIEFGRHREKLRAAGRHLKRGLLLYGPPGTGKTLTAMYLATASAERTTFILTGVGFKMLKSTCEVARSLEPANIIIEDVDLIGEDRDKSMPGCSMPLLFELLNEMEGLADDADIFFLLTTNRAEILEPALASRPGRVDMAVEIPLPDAACRRRLLDYYAHGLALDGVDWTPYIRRTDGASGAFLREFLRRAALFAAGDDHEIVVSPVHLDAALTDLADLSSPLGRQALGFRAGSGE